MDTISIKQYVVLYDDKCDACQVGTHWVRRLDRRGLVRFVGLEEGLRGGVHPSLQVEECRRLMHVVTPDGRLWVGWEAVTGLARLFPVTWMVGVVGWWRPVRWVGHRIYRWVADHRYVISHATCRLGGVKPTGPGGFREAE